ncbi:MAG TPA: hypothetical protein VFC57_00555 [Aeromicrobium sp.]|jgi:preprotein translocase subunit SecB|nr:hypothetical protein [Aeromicrobium sp.]
MSGAIDSILRLNDFRVMKSYFEVNESVRPADDPELNMSVGITLLQSTDSDDDMAVQLTVDINGEEEQFKSSGFTGCVVVTGFFAVSELRAERPDDWEPALIYNGVTVLFGTVRTLFADLSAASPAGRIIVPTINVAEILRAESSEGVDDARAPAE